MFVIVKHCKTVILSSKHPRDENYPGNLAVVLGTVPFGMENRLVSSLHTWLMPVPKLGMSECQVKNDSLRNVSVLLRGGCVPVLLPLGVPDRSFIWWRCPYGHMEGWLREVVWLKTGWGGGEGRSILFLACRSGFPYGQMIALPRAREAVESTQQEMASDLLLAAVSNYVSFQ